MLANQVKVVNPLVPVKVVIPLVPVKVVIPLVPVKVATPLVPVKVATPQKLAIRRAPVMGANRILRLLCASPPSPVSSPPQLHDVPALMYGRSDLS